MIRFYVEGLPPKAPHQARFTAVVFPAPECEQAARQMMANAWATASPLVLLTEADFRAVADPPPFVDPFPFDVHAAVRRFEVQELHGLAKHFRDLARLKNVQADTVPRGDQSLLPVVDLLRETFAVLRDAHNRAGMGPPAWRAGRWEFSESGALVRCDLYGRPVVTLRPYASTLNGSPVEGWHWAMDGGGQSGSTVGVDAFVGAMKDADAWLTSQGWALDSQLGGEHAAR